MRPSSFVVGFFALLMLAVPVFALTHINSCAVLDSAGETYVLDNDLSGSLKNGACIHITVEGVTLDCDKHVISSLDTATDIYGVLIEADEATVTNCAIGGYSYDSDVGYGVYASGYRGLNISDVDFSGNDYAVRLHQAHDSVLERNTVTKNTYDAFVISWSNRLELDDNHADGSDIGFDIASCDYATLRRNTAMDNGNSGFRLYESSYSVIEGNDASGNGGDGFYIWAQAPESYSNFTGNIAHMNNEDGFHIQNEDHNRFVENNATNNTLNGFHVEYDAWYPGANANYNVFIDNNAIGNGHGTRCMPGTFPCPRNGFLVEQADYTYFSGNYAYNNEGAGFFVYRSEHNVLEDNLAEMNLEHGYQISAHEDIRKSRNNLTRNVAYQNMMDGFFLQDDQNRLVSNDAIENGANGFELAPPFCISWNCSGNGNILIDNTAESNGQDRDAYCEEPGGNCYNGFLLVGVNDTILERNRALANPGHGFYVYNGAYNSLDGNNASRNDGNGFYVLSGGSTSHNDFTWNRAESNGEYGFLVRDEYTLLEDNWAYDSGMTGYMVNSPHTTLRRNTAGENAMYGFYIDSTILSKVYDVLLEDNVAYGHNYCPRDCEGAGFRFRGTSVLTSSEFGAEMSDNTAFYNDYGVDAQNGDLTMSGDHFYENTIDFHIANPSDFIISSLRMEWVTFDDYEGLYDDYSTLSITDDLMYDGLLGGQGYSITGTGCPTRTYPYAVPFHFKFVEITDDCDDPKVCYAADIDEIAWFWSSQEAKGFHDIQLWEYNDSGWVYRDDAVITYMSATIINLTGFSIFGLFGNDTAVPGAGGDDGNGGGGEDGCASDSDCAENERCEGGLCSVIPCSCGYYQEHRCIPYACCDDSDCGTGERCEGHTCVPKSLEEPECVQDSDCAWNRYCDDGSCLEVEFGPCGEVKDHRFVPYGYECGEETGCPACDAGEECEDHACVIYGISCPSIAMVGQQEACSATRDGQPCAFCEYEVTSPEGMKTRGNTDGYGGFSFPLDKEGTYRISLNKEERAVRTIEIRAEARGGIPQLPEQTPEENLCLVSTIALAVIAAMVATYWMSRKKKVGKKA